MFGLLDAIKIGAGAIVGGFLAYQVGHWSGAQAGRAAIQSELAAAATAAEQGRAADDAQLQTLSDRDLCVRALRARGMPINTCTGLRGVPRDRP